jgi:hypothetical protein
MTSIDRNGITSYAWSKAVGDALRLYTAEVILLIPYG